jgi:hypothetical protein
MTPESALQHNFFNISPETVRIRRWSIVKEAIESMEKGMPLSRIQNITQNQKPSEIEIVDFGVF